MGLVSSVIATFLGVFVLSMLFYHRKAILAFVFAARQEMKRVVWPTPERAFIQMKIVVISLLVVTCFFGLVDYILYQLVDFVF